LIDRRQFVGGSLGLLLASLVRVPRARAGLDADVVGALASSPLVYISPLRSDGEESRCHGEVWYAWLDDSVVINTATDRW